MAAIQEIYTHAGSWVGNDGRRRYVLREILGDGYSLRLNLTEDELISRWREGRRFVIPGMGKYLPGSPNAPDWMPEVA